MEINSEIAAKVLATVDAGLVKGVGKPVPGQMCVEAAVCYAMGLPHGDEPDCVSPAIRSLKITLNDANWSSDMARAKGMRRLALAQLGSADVVDNVEFCRQVSVLAIRLCVPVALRAAASIHPDPAHKSALLNAADLCEREPTNKSAESAAGAAWAATRAAWAAADAAGAAWAATRAATWAAGAAAWAATWAAGAAAGAGDKTLSDFAEGVVQVLIGMNAPGCQWLSLTEESI